MVSLSRAASMYLTSVRWSQTHASAHCPFVTICEMPVGKHPSVEYDCVVTLKKEHDSSSAMLVLRGGATSPGHKASSGTSAQGKGSWKATSPPNIARSMACPFGFVSSMLLISDR